MIDYKTLTIERLLDSLYADQVLAEGHRLVLFPTDQSKKLAKVLSTLLQLETKTTLSPLEKKYQQLVIQLQSASLDHYSEREIISFFERKIFSALGSEDFDIWDRIKAKLIDIPITDRDDFREQLTNALYRNSQKISKSITIGDRTFPGIVGNWVKQYVDVVGIEANDKMKHAQYFSDNKTFNSLPLETKEKLQELFGIYAQLQLSSYSTYGYEETVTIVDEDGNLFDMENGTMVPISTAKRAVEGTRLATRQPEQARNAEDGMRLLQKHFKKYRADRKRILEAEDKLMIDTKGDVTEVKRTLAAASRAKNTVLLTAALKVLARQGALTTALQANPGWLEATKEYVSEKYKNSVPTADLEMATSTMKSETESPAVVAEFLQYLLKKKAGLNENESALVGVELGQLLGGQYLDIAYGNEAAGTFEWSKNVIQNKQLVRMM